MITFVKIPANKTSLAARGSVCGVGINDAWYITKPVVDGKNITCPAYEKWSSMLKRCYSFKYKERQPTYKDCAVCDEWLSFSNFAKWFEVNYVNGYELDKDIKVKGNKIYSPETCLFIPSCVNSLLLDSGAIRGNYPMGVCLHKPTNRYRAYVKIDGKRVSIGYFATPELAGESYVIAKNEEIMRKCGQYPEFAKYLINHLL